MYLLGNDIYTIRNLKIFFVFFAANIFSFSAHAQKAEKVSLRADTWCPYNCKPDSEKPGLMIEVAQKAFGKANVDYQIAPWKRAIVDTREAQFDGIVGAASGDAPDFLMASPLGKSVTCFYSRKEDTWNYVNHASIKGKKMGSILAYSYPDFVLAYTADKTNNQSVEISGDGVLLNLLKMLPLKRIDLVPEDKNVANYMIESNAELKDQVREAGCTTDPDTSIVSIAFSPKQQVKSIKLVKKLNETIAEMTQSGEMETLAKKYKIEKWY